MKLENVKVGMRVFVKAKPAQESYASKELLGKIGTVAYVEPSNYDGNLTVKVDVEDVDEDEVVDWMSHKDIRKLRDGEI